MILYSIEIILNFLLEQIFKLTNISNDNLNINNITNNDFENIIYKLYYNQNISYINNKFILDSILQNNTITTDLYIKLKQYLDNEEIEDIFELSEYNTKLMFIHIIFNIISKNKVHNIYFTAEEIIIFKDFINSDIENELKNHILSYTPFNLFYKYIEILDYDEINILIDICSYKQLIVLYLKEKIKSKEILYFFNNISKKINLDDNIDIYKKLYIDSFNEFNFIIDRIKCLEDFKLIYNNPLSLNYNIMFEFNWINIYDNQDNILELQINGKLYELLLSLNNICDYNYNFKYIENIIFSLDKKNIIKYKIIKPKTYTTNDQYLLFKNKLKNIMSNISSIVKINTIRGR